MLLRPHARDPLPARVTVNQSDIASNLACLPIFLAGCSELLVIAGPTFTERLWCIMEVYVRAQRPLPPLPSARGPPRRT